MTENALDRLPAQRTSIATRDELDVIDIIAQVKKIQLVMSEVMKDGEHYGVIPGTNKPTLLKPGAEKLLLTFRFDPQYESTETYDDKHLTVKSRCTLYHITSGQRMGSGEGSCSTKESKYAYREAKRACPRCGMETILKSRFPSKSNPKAEPGWYCFAKRGGCGFEFAADDIKITEQKLGRVANEDLADQYNTVLKMANKRSLIAAVLNVTAASDIFTQDLEDNHGQTPGQPMAYTTSGNSDHRDAAPNAVMAATPGISSGAVRLDSTDPEDHHAESESLFTIESEEVAKLITEISKYPEARRKVVMKRMDFEPEQALAKFDAAALNMILTQLKLRPGEAK